MSAPVFIKGEMCTPTGFTKACCVMLRLLEGSLPTLLPKDAVCLLGCEQHRGKCVSELTFGFSTLNGLK